MTRIHVMLACAALLLAAVVWQNWPAGQDVPAARKAPQTAAPVAAAVPDASPDLPALAAHPLFSPSRQPPPAPPAPDAAPAPEPAVTAPPPPPAPAEPVLQGLVLTPAPGAAYLGEGPEGPSHFLRPGQSALGLTLEAVQPGRATFRSADGEVTLTLQEARPTPPPDAAPAAAMPEVSNTAQAPAARAPDTAAPDTAAPEGTVPQDPSPENPNPDSAGTAAPGTLPEDAFAPQPAETPPANP